MLQHRVAKSNQIAKFDKFNTIFQIQYLKIYNMLPDFLCLIKKNGICKCILCKIPLHNHE